MSPARSTTLSRNESKPLKTICGKSLLRFSAPSLRFLDRPPLSAPPIPSLGPVPPNPYSGAAPALSPSSFPTLMSGPIQIPGSHGMGVIPGATAAHSYSYPPPSPVSTSSRYGAPGMALPTTAPNPHPLGLPTPTGSALTQVSTTPIPTSSIVQAQRSRNPGHARRPSAPEMGFALASTPRPPARRRLSGYEHTYSGFPPPPIHPTPAPSSAARSSLSPIVSPTRTAASSTSAGMRAPSPAVPSRGQGSSRSGPRDDVGSGAEVQRSGGFRHSFNATGSPVSPLRVLSLFAVSLDASGGAPVPVHAHCAMELREESMGGGALAVTSVHLARRGRDWLPNSKAYSQRFLIERPAVARQDCSGALAMPPRRSFALVGHFFMGIQSRHAVRKRRRRRNCRR
ncbi:hypothetical protein HMN09_01106900 [Mycena chlorophos]|uniref:Uncharacterized protein n=1 Tax=Mycena chlorophos TaxID=658473 RepID=A0A8H6SBH7_MYCCL|nr:hypothetical protein HMN09_01106900 [Mycena chlorophos]